MKLSGLIRTNCPPDRLMALLHDPLILARMLPKGCEVTKSGEGSFDFAIRRAFGPINLSLPGTMTLMPTGTLQDHVLTAHAAHIIGGKVELTLTLAARRTDGTTKLSYEGDLQATGLAGRLMKEYESQADDGMRAAFQRLKKAAEAPGPAGQRNKTA